MKRLRNLLAVVTPMVILLIPITTSRGDESTPEFTVVFEWVAKPTLKLSKANDDGYEISLDFDRVPSNRIAEILTRISKNHAPKVARVETTMLDEEDAVARFVLRFEPIADEEVGAALKLLVDAFDLPEITMDAKVLEGKGTAQLFKLLGRHDADSNSRAVLRSEINTAIEASLPESNSRDSGWRVEIQGYHHYETVE